MENNSRKRDVKYRILEGWRMAENGLTFIHLSDIHFNKNSCDNYDLDDDLRNEMLEDIKRESDILDKISGILISGDIAFSGNKIEYENAEKFLLKLCQILDVSETSIYCVPGNHDVDQDKIKNSHSLKNAQSSIEESQDIDDEIAGYMRDPGFKTQMYSPLHEYNNFSAKFNCNIDADKQIWKEDLELNDGSLLRLYGLNSVIISSHMDKEDRKMVLGENQVPHSENGVLYVVIGHHPPELWKDSEEVKKKLSSRAHIQLYGHKHSQSIVVKNNSLTLYSGAAHPSRKENEWKPRYNWLKVYVNGVGDNRLLMIRVYPRVLDDTNNKFIADRNSCSNSHYVEHLLELPFWKAEGLPSLEEEKITIMHKVRNKKDITTTASITNPIRTIVYRFFGLSYTIRTSLLNELKLLYDEDDGIEHTKLFRKLLIRAEEKSILSELWDKIEAAHGDGKYVTNPFKENI